MKGYVARKGDRYYAVIYEGLDPLTGRERRRWYPAGTCRAVAESLAAQLATDHRRDRVGARSSLTVGVYLIQRWLPAKRLSLRPSTWDSYRRNIDLHVIPHIGRIPLRHLRVEHIERLYASLFADGRSSGPGGLGAKTVLEIHIVLRRALADAVRRGAMASNPAALAHAPKRRPLASAASRAWNAQQLREFLDFSANHRVHAALWLVSNTGMRRGEVLGLRWGDVDLDAARLSVNRSLVSVGYELHESRGKTRTARRTIDLDERTVEMLRRWRDRRVEEDEAFDPGDDDGFVFAPARRSAPAPPPALRCLQQAGEALRSASDTASRSPPHPCDTPAQIRRAYQGGQRTTRPLDARLHHGHLPARPSRHASRGRTGLRGPARASTGFVKR